METLTLASERMVYTIPTRDSLYYFQDGGCIIRVEDCLFRIHKYLLERDSPLLRKILETVGGGDSDDNPIVSQGSVDDFRALFWVLYAKPRDTFAQQNWDTVDIPRLIRVAGISHKYEIEYFCDWALDIIDLHFTARPKELIPRCGGWPSVDRILNLSYECGRLPLAVRIQAEWIEMIRNSETGESRAAFEAALDVGERYPHRRKFHGYAYYMYLQGIGAFEEGPGIGPKASRTELVDFSPSTFNEQRARRLCQGFWSLTQLRSKLSIAPQMDDNPSCLKHSTDCVPGWTGWWEKTLKGISPTPCNPGEVIIRMKSFIPKQGDKWSFVQTVRKDKKDTKEVERVIHCRDLLIRQLEDLSTVFYSSIPDHFMIQE